MEGEEFVDQLILRTSLSGEGNKKTLNFFILNLLNLSFTSVSFSREIVFFFLPGSIGLTLGHDGFSFRFD